MAEMMEQYGSDTNAPTYARRIVTMEHLIKLFFELATDTAFIPGQHKRDPALLPCSRT